MQKFGFDWVPLAYLLLFPCLERLTLVSIAHKFIIRELLCLCSYQSFMVSCLICKSLSNFEFIFVHNVREYSDFTDLHMDVQLS